jgi:tRNA 2-selenouridine synthase
MAAPIHTTTDWMQSFDTVIDVRSPDEFARDHIPGAINLPVLSNDERAEVGTIYKQTSPFEARRFGAQLISSNIAMHLDEVLGDKPLDWTPLVYCWRGGKRSASMARVMAEIGWSVTLLEGGYKAYRHDVTEQLDALASRLKVVLIKGPTGSAKTHILTSAINYGVQGIDLEGLARHRGSLLGFEPDQEQPSQRMFESLIFAELRRLDLSRPVLIEAESSRVGECHIPQGLWKIMQDAQLISIEAEFNARVEFLLRDYPHLMAEPERITCLIDGMIMRHGHEVTAQWKDHVKNERWAELVTALINQHYDPAYATTSARKSGKTLAHLTADSLTPAAIDDLARQIAVIFDKIQAEV